MGRGETHLHADEGEDGKSSRGGGRGDGRMGESVEEDADERRTLNNRFGILDAHISCSRRTTLSPPQFPISKRHGLQMLGGGEKKKHVYDVVILVHEEFVDRSLVWVANNGQCFSYTTISGSPVVYG